MTVTGDARPAPADARKAGGAHRKRRPRRTSASRILDLLAEVETLSRDVRAAQQRELQLWPRGAFAPDRRSSRANLAAYLGLRRHDIRPIQDQLARLGISSLGRSEAHVRASLASVATILAALAGVPSAARRAERLAHLADAQSRLLDGRSTELLGPPPARRRTRIMVTLPETATDGPLMLDLVRRGMDVARINAAHDDPETWRLLARRVREASKSAGRPCAVMIDLPGPKLRVGPFELTPPTIRLRARGDHAEPVRFLLDGSGASGEAGMPDRSDAPEAWARVPVDPAWLEALRAGDVIDLEDARGKVRRLHVEGRVTPLWVVVSSDRRLDVAEGLRLVLRRDTNPATRIGPFTPVPVDVRVSRGDQLILARGTSIGRAAQLDRNGAVVRPAVIACLQPEMVDALRVGDPVAIDDGHIHTRCVAIEKDGAVLRVERVRGPGERIRSDQGLNFPRSRLKNPGLTDLDRRALDVAVDVADLVAVSFVQTPADVERVRLALEDRGETRMGIIAKIETLQGVDALPTILAAGLGPRPFGVMIARGDLAVEIGYERLAEMQEELLWLCEAAHVPVIWATQVLETLIKTGIPSRAEVTDAAMAERAEGVMLNKGPFILDGLATLVDIVGRMETHQRKKTPRLRALRSW